MDYRLPNFDMLQINDHITSFKFLNNSQTDGKLSTFADLQEDHNI